MKKFLRVFFVFCLLLISIAAFSACALLGDLTGEGRKLSAEEIYEKVSPSVVAITAESTTSTSSGTGFFYNNGSTVVTNYHVIEGCTSAYITLPNGNKYEVLSVLGYDAYKDIAILKVNYTNGKPLTVRTTEVKTGETVYAIGNSLGFLEGSLSEGIVSTAKREVDGYTYIQTTAAVTHGNSGGPLIDAYGKIIGIVSAGFGDGLDLNLAIPISQVATVSIQNPQKPSEMIYVGWITDRQVWHVNEENRFALVFTLLDLDKQPVAAAGWITITIMNDDKEIVYEKVKYFDEDNYQYWYYDNNTVEKYHATIYIDDKDIAQGYCSEGELTFNIVGTNYSFSEYKLKIDGLPQKSIYNDSVVEKTVYTAQELVDNLIHNRKIILGSDYYDLSTVDISNNKLLSSQFSGKGFAVNNVYNLSIEGDAEIVIGDLQANVLYFNNCSKLNLEGLTLGHITPSNTHKCEGGVVRLDNCRDVIITDCKLFGCGSVGIDANSTTGLTVTSTEIYDCTFAGVDLWKSSATFDKCKLYNLPTCYAAIYSTASSVGFSNCLFADTNVYWSDGDHCFLNVAINGGISSTLFENCVFSNNTFANIATVGAKNIVFDNCSFVGNMGDTAHSGVTYRDCSFK